MKRFGTWMFRLLTQVLAVVLIIIILPYAFQLASRLLPNISGQIQTESMTLFRNLKSSQRLETEVVEEEGIVESKTTVVLLGTVGKTTVSYRYQASVGIDLSKVQMRVNGKQLTFYLPQPEILNDHIEALEVHRNDFFSHAIDKNVETLLEEQRKACRAECLADGENTAKLWKSTENAFRETVGQWMNQAGGSTYTIILKQAEQDS